MAAQNLAEIISSLTAEEQESVLQFVELLKQKESRLSSCVPHDYEVVDEEILWQTIISASR